MLYEKRDEYELELEIEVDNIKEGHVIAKGPCPTDQEGKWYELWICMGKFIKVFFTREKYGIQYK